MAILHGDMYIILHGGTAVASPFLLRAPHPENDSSGVRFRDAAAHIPIANPLPWTIYVMNAVTSCPRLQHVLIYNGTGLLTRIGRMLIATIPLRGLPADYVILPSADGLSTRQYPNYARPSEAA